MRPNFSCRIIRYKVSVSWAEWTAVVMTIGRFTMSLTYLRRLSMWVWGSERSAAWRPSPASTGWAMSSGRGIAEARPTPSAPSPEMITLRRKYSLYSSTDSYTWKNHLYSILFSLAVTYYDLVLIIKNWSVISIDVLISKMDLTL